MAYIKILWHCTNRFFSIYARNHGNNRNRTIHREVLSPKKVEFRYDFRGTCLSSVLLQKRNPCHSTVTL